VNCRLERLSAAAAPLLAVPLARLHRSCFPDDPWPPPEIARIMAINGFFGWLAWQGEAPGQGETSGQGETPAGLALALDLGGECELLTLGVAPCRQRQGTGAVLLRAVCEEAGRRGGRAVFLEVATDNTAALALYAAAGFIQIGRRTNYYCRADDRIDALVLRRNIAATIPST
jgi:[ribosomal protein S18]-alanine N-acetyltransferase